MANWPGDNMTADTPMPQIGRNSSRGQTAISTARWSGHHNSGRRKRNRSGNGVFILPDSRHQAVPGSQAHSFQGLPGLDAGTETRQDCVRGSAKHLRNGESFKQRRTAAGQGANVLLRPENALTGGTLREHHPFVKSATQVHQTPTFRAMIARIHPEEPTLRVVPKHRLLAQPGVSGE